MVTPVPIRSGHRMGGAEGPATVYAHPPLVECWLQVNVLPGGELSAADSHGLQATLGPEWPGAWQLIARADASSEIQLTNVMLDRALRLTAHGFAFGWLGHGGERYPRYESVRDGFVAVLDAVRTLADRRGRPFVPQTWSVRYVNRIPRGTVWCNVGQWEFFNLWQPQHLKSLGIDPAGFHAHWDLSLEAEQGNLAIDFRHESGSAPEADDSLRLELTASGPVGAAETGLFDGMDYGREVIVRGFNELVSAEAKAYWGGTVQSR